MNIFSKLFSGLKKYFKIIRVGRTLWFVYIIIGIFLVSGFQGIVDHLSEIIQVFIFMGLITYSGIYALNKYVDLEEDKNTQYKSKENEIIDGVKPKTILLIAIINIVLGLILSYIYLLPYIIPLLALLIVNLLYTLILKRLNRFLAVVIVASTHALRLSIGFLVANADISKYLPTLFTLYMVSILTHIGKQQVKGNLTTPVYIYIQYGLIFLSLAFSTMVLFILKDTYPIIIALVGSFATLLYLKTDFKKLFS